MTNLTAIFGTAPEKPAETSDKLRELYWNRAELKKQLANLRDEKFRLQEVIKEKEGISAGVRQQLEHLEELLLDPESVYDVIVCYQLRSLNLQCKSKLANFAEHLKQQRERRLREHLLADWNAARKGEADTVQNEIGEQRFKVQMLEDQLLSDQHKLRSATGLLNVFRRRVLERAVAGVSADLDAAQQLESHLVLKIDEIQKRHPPETQGLDIATKRRINFMIISFAQHLFLHYAEDGLAAMSQEAGHKSAGLIKYGSARECDAILEKINARKEAFEKLTDFAESLQHRAQLIAEKALFRSDDDAVPTHGTVTTLFEIGKTGVVSEKELNLLDSDYWDISKVLSR